MQNEQTQETKERKKERLLRTKAKNKRKLRKVFDTEIGKGNQSPRSDLYDYTKLVIEKEINKTDSKNINKEKIGKPGQANYVVQVDIFTIPARLYTKVRYRNKKYCSRLVSRRSFVVSAGRVSVTGCYIPGDNLLRIALRILDRHVVFSSIPEVLH